MLEIKLFNAIDRPNFSQKQELIQFLYINLQEYKDSTSAIEKAIQYSVKEIPSFGGYIVKISENQILLAVAVVNKTGMSEYIPENILVYIAVHKDYRKKGLGKKLIREVKKYCQGDIALHVEPENPAVYLYEKEHFVKKYIEMRYIN